jgi:opacity protein-like surface antigen
MARRIIVAALLAASCGAIVPARADDLDKPRFSFSGFGTIGVTHSNEAGADFTASILKNNGAGYTRRWSADVDSRLGGQVTFNMTPQWSAVLQLVAEQRYDNSYRPIVEWANVKYQATPDFSLRAGRIALPNYLLADYRKVGYAIPWARTPVEVYGLVPITNSDGVDATWRMHFGSVQNAVQASYGMNDVSIQGGTVRIRHLTGLSDTVEVGFASLRATWLQADLDIDVTHPLFDGFRQFAAVGGDLIADKYDVNGKRANFVGLGASYDPGPWFVMAEYGNIVTRTYLGEQSAWHVSGGWRHGEFTPYLTVGEVRANTPTYDPGLPVAFLPPAAAAAAGQLNAGLNGLLAAQPVQKSVTAGLRWDFRRNMSLKLEFQQIRTGGGTAGTLINVQPGFVPGSTVKLFSTVLDFVF